MYSNSDKKFTSQMSHMRNANILSCMVFKKSELWCTMLITLAYGNLTTSLTCCLTAPEISQQWKRINTRDRQTNLAVNLLHQCHLLSPDPEECDHRGSSYEHQHHASITQHHKSSTTLYQSPLLQLKHPFSAVHRLKNYIRATMIQKRMNNEMQMHCHKDWVDAKYLISMARTIIGTKDRYKK